MSTSLRSWASALGGTVSGTSILCPGPGHSHKDRSLSVRLIASAPDGFLVYSHAGDDPLVCKDYIRAKLGLPAFTPQIGAPAAVPGARLDILQPAPQTDEEIGRASKSGTIKVRGTIVEAYLASRGLTLPNDVANIRFHPMCSFESEHVPAMVAAMRDIRTDEIVGVHRTRLSADGQKLGRKMLGRASNAAIKIE